MDRLNKELEKIIKYNFKKSSLLQKALTHKSLDNNINKVLDSSEKWLKNIYVVDNILDKELIKKQKESVKFEFDFNSWLQDVNQPIRQVAELC